MENLVNKINNFLNYGYGDGGGNGSGDLCGSILNGNKIYNIDSVPTIIKSVKGDFAKGFTVNRNLTLNFCYIAKSESVFAHGKTIKEELMMHFKKSFWKTCWLRSGLKGFYRNLKPGLCIPTKSFLTGTIF